MGIVGGQVGNGQEDMGIEWTSRYVDSWWAG